jgi:hypothetical protein
MAYFIQTHDRDGKAVLVNLDRVTTIETLGNKWFRFRGPDMDTELEVNESFSLKDDTTERISSNLYHIWEILRARLH